MKQVLVKNAMNRATVSVSDTELTSSPESIKAHQRQENNVDSVGEDLLRVAEGVNATVSSRMCTIL